MLLVGGEACCTSRFKNLKDVTVSEGVAPASRVHALVAAQYVRSCPRCGGAALAAVQLEPSAGSVVSSPKGLRTAYLRQEFCRRDGSGVSSGDSSGDSSGGDASCDGGSWTVRQELSSAFSEAMATLEALTRAEDRLRAMQGDRHGSGSMAAGAGAGSAGARSDNGRGRGVDELQGVLDEIDVLQRRADGLKAYAVDQKVLSVRGKGGGRYT